MLNVHLRINDATTGQPTPVRLRVTAPDGTHFAPLGRSAEFPIGRNEAVGGYLKIAGERWAYIDGSCEIPLPAGVPLRVQATKGPEYTPCDETVTLGAGQLALRFTLERWTERRAGGWVSVDGRCHFLPPNAAILEASGEDLDVVNVLATPFTMLALNGETYVTTPELLAFSGQVPALERNGCAIFVNTQNTHPVLGKVALLNSHRPVFPLAFGEPYDSDDWGICDWCDQCHRKQGLAVWVDACEPMGGVTAGEALVAAILGKIDAIEVTAGPRKVPLFPWIYRLWDAGVMVPLIGSSGKESNRTALGSMRTYARVSPNDPRPNPWIEAIRAGNSFVTAGPLLDFSLTGTRFRAEVRSQFPNRVEVVVNGRVVASGETEVEADIAEAGWVTARCHSVIGGFAHTSPLVVGTSPRKPEAVAALRGLIEQTQSWAEARGQYTNPKRREQLVARCAAAVAKLGESV